MSADDSTEAEDNDEPVEIVNTRPAVKLTPSGVGPNQCETCMKKCGSVREFISHRRAHKGGRLSVSEVR